MTERKVLGDIRDLQTPRGILTIVGFSLLWFAGDLLAAKTFNGIGCNWYPNGGLAIAFATYFGWQMGFVIWILRVIMAVAFWNVPYDSFALITYTTVPAVTCAIMSIPLRRAIQFKERVDSSRVGLIFSQLAFIGSFVVAVLSQLLNWMAGLVPTQQLGPTIINWFSGDLIGFVTMGPFALLWLCPALFGRWDLGSLKRVNFVSMCSLLTLYATIMAILFWVFPSNHFSFWHLIVLIYLFSSWNFGLAVTTIVVPIINFSLLTLELLHPSHVAPLEQQIFLTMITGGGLLLALLCDENRRRYEQSANLAQSLDQVADAQYNFFSNLCHEIRNPLHLIAGFSEMFDSKDPQSRDLSRKIHESSRDLLRIVERLVTLGRGERMANVLEPEQVDLRQWLAERIGEWEIRAKEKSLSLRLKFADDNAKYLILAHPTSMKLVVDELIDNALKFTHQGEIEILVNHAQGTLGRIVRLNIQDTGIGLGAEDFNIRTFMQNPDLNRAFSGMGVGLSLAQSLLEADHGHLRIQPSPRGQGTSVIADYLAAGD